MRAICAGFVSQPAECSSLLSPRDPFIPGKNTSDGISVRTSTIVLLVLGGVAGVAFLLYKRTLQNNVHNAIREEVMLEVSTQMATYSKLPASGRFGTSVILSDF